MSAAPSFLPICGHVFDGMICTLHRDHHACAVGMHFSTERAPKWWMWRWSRLPGIQRHPVSILWSWSRVARSRALATGTTSAVTTDRARVTALLARLKEGPPKRVGRLDGHVEGERVCDCCDRADEYNGFDSGPTIFTCPRHCGCHD